MSLCAYQGVSVSDEAPFAFILHDILFTSEGQTIAFTGVKCYRSGIVPRKENATEELQWPLKKK